MGHSGRNNQALDALHAFGIAYGMTKGVMLDKDLQKAGDVKPETVDNVQVADNTPNTEGMVQDSETGRYVPKLFDADGNMTEAGLTQTNGVEGGEASPGVDPTFKSTTTRSYRLGDTEQAAPFSQEQLDARRYRNQADVYSKHGLPERAASIQGLAKAREEEATMKDIRAGGVAGLKNGKDMRAEEKNFAITKGMYESALKLNRPDLAAGYYAQMNKARDELLAHANDRADKVYRATGGNISGFVDTYNKYVADGNTIDAFQRNDDGSHTFSINDGTGKTRDINVPKEKISEYLLALRDPKRIAELEQRRAEILFKASADAQEALNKPVAVGRDQTLVVPSTGQTFAPGANRGFDPKESGSVLDDISKIFVSKYGQADPNNPLAPKGLSDEGLAKASLAHRLFMENRNLPPAAVAEIADKGTLGVATVEIGGQMHKVPAVHYNGRAFLLGGSNAGMPTPAPQPTAAPGPTGLGTRSVSGKIGDSGLQRVEPSKKAEPVAFNAPELDRHASEVEQALGLPSNLLLAVKNVGERSNNDQVSPKGAAGVMQFMPATARQYGVDPTNPQQAIEGAGRYLVDLIKQYGGNVAAAVAHYNGGSSQGQLVAAGQQPSYPETRAYVARVMKSLA